jgi:hypothetical protein
MMKKTNRWYLLAGLLGLFAVQSLQAASLNCGVHVIQEGERNSATKYEVLKKCGEPKYREGNSWIYSRGGRDTEVYFKDGKVERIR